VKLVVLWIQLPLFAIVIGPLNAFASANPAASVLQTAGTYAMAAIVAFAAITLVFALLERYPGKTTLNWDPRRLSRFTLPKAILDADPKLWPRCVSQAVFSTVFALGWQYLVQHWNSFDFGTIGTKFGPILHATYVPLMLTLLAGIAQALAALLFPSNTPLRAAIAAPFLPASSFMGDDAQWMHLGLQLPLLFVAVAVVGDAVKELWRINRSRRPGHTWTMKPAPGK
jgi:hypothetical protein